MRLWRRSDPPLDLDDDASIEEAARRGGCQTAAFDLVLVATGLLHGAGVTPELSLRHIEGAALDRLFRVNATGPALVIRHFLPLLARDTRGVIAAMSARVGSTGDKRIRGWLGYRAAKAALNQVIRTIAFEMKRTHPAALLVGLHSGTVDTDLSAPLQRNVAKDRLLTPDRASGLLFDV